MLKVYGSLLCRDCVECREAFDQSGVAYEFCDFFEDIRNLKTFLQYRDTDPAFNEIRGTDVIGIPCIVSSDGSVSLDWEQYVSQEES